jgi:hypothetical protein
MAKKPSPDRAAASAAIVERETSRNLPLPHDIAQALQVIAKRNGKTLKVALADLAATLDLKAGLQHLSARYRAEADAELTGLFGASAETGE